MEEGKMKQTEIAKQLGISNSYLSMILNGKRQIKPELEAKLQSINGIHKVVKKQLPQSLPKQAVASSSLVSRSMKLSNRLLTACMSWKYKYNI